MANPVRLKLKILLLIAGATISVSGFAQVQTKCRPNTLGTGLNCTSNFPQQPQSDWQNTINLLGQAKRDKAARAREKELDEKIREGQQKLDELNQQAEIARIEYEQALAREEAERQAVRELNQQVSKAVLEHRCEDAKTIALSAGQLAMAERAMRLCTQPSSMPPARNSSASPSRKTPTSASMPTRAMDSAVRH